MDKRILSKNRTLSIYDSRVRELRRNDARFNIVCERVGDISHSLYDNDYEFFVSTFIGQMLSNKAADTIYNRLIKLCGGELSPDKVNMLFDEEIREIGISAQKLGYIRHLTDDILNGKLSLSHISDLDDNDALKELIKIRGIGNWSAKMYLIFVLDRENILPIEDVAFLQGYEWMSGTRDVDALVKDAEKWQPYSSLVARFLYKALDGGFTKVPI